MALTLEQKTETERTEVGNVAAGFRELIDAKQAEFDKTGEIYSYADLLTGTKYEKAVTANRQNNGVMIEIKTALSLYRWEYKDLVVAGNRSATLTEKQTDIY